MNQKDRVVRIAVSGRGPGPCRWPGAGLLIVALLAGGAAHAATEPLPAADFAVLLAAGLGIAAAAMAFLLLRAGRRLSRVADDRDLVTDALDAVPHARIVIAPDGAAARANQAWRRMVGLNEAAPFAPLEAALADDGSRDTLRRLHQAASAGGHAEGELCVTTPSGDTEWRAAFVYPLADRPGYALWGLEDITARRAAEQNMREERTQLADLMENAPIGFYSVAGDGRFLFINDTLAGWLGHTPREITGSGMRLHDFVVAGDLSRCDPFSPFPKGADESHGEVTLKGREKLPFQAYISQTVAGGEDGDGVRTRSLVRDLTAERESAETLSQSEQRFRRYFDEAPVGIVLLDASGVVIECSVAFAGMVHAERSHVTGSEFAAFIGDDERGRVTRWLADALARDDSTVPLEVNLAGDGGVIAALFAHRYVEKAGAETGLVVHVLDQTEQKNLEAQFFQSQKMEMVGQLAGGVAHDFNNLLTAMIGFCDLLLQRHSPKDQSFADIMQIKQNANRAANLVRQLLAFSRQQTLQPRVINITDVLAELTHLLRRLIGANIELQMVHARDLGLVRVDESQLEQVIINLAVNARDAIEAGGTLTIRTRNVAAAEVPSLSHGPMPDRDYVVLEISDTGCGIPRPILDKIFEPFFTTKEVGSGTGLGLSTVYGIVKQTGGYIFADSAPGRGATFTIYLPRLEGEIEEDEVEPVERRVAGVRDDLTGAGTVMLVEDEDAVRMFGARALRNKGYNVIEAPSGEDALEILNGGEQTIDIVITDVIMPGMDGPALFRHVREKYPDMKVIFISGYTEDSFRKRLDVTENIHFLPKPFSLQQLAGKVKEIMTDGG